MSTATSLRENVVTPRRTLSDHVRDVWTYRELLVGMVRKELKVKYKNSLLGFLWSMLNPAMYLAVFYVVFQIILRSGIPNFAIYLLSGLLVWNLFANSLGNATGSITGNLSLVNKVNFPREVLPLAAVGSNLVHFFLQALVLLGVLAVFRYGVSLDYVWLVLPALVVLLLLTGACAIFLAAVNVYARDAQHLLELLLLAWFWLTPIVYPWYLPATKFAERGLPGTLTLLNPITVITLAMQRAIYGRTSFVDPNDASARVQQLMPDESALWYLRNLVVVGVVAAVLLALALRLFGRLEANFAEEL
jgi:ABC-2 type transport system permease protein